MNNQEIEREIDLKDAFFYLLYHWRSILVGALIGVVLLAGYKYISFEPQTESGVSEEQKSYERELKVYKLTKDSYETQAASYEKQLKQLQDYIETSPRMKIDPMQEKYASAQLYVEIPVEDLAKIPESANMDITDQVLGAYSNFISKGIDLSDIAEENGVKESRILELVSSWSDYSSNMINIDVIAPDEKMAKEILSEVLRQVEMQEDTIAADVRNHKLTVINRTSGVRCDNDLRGENDDLYSQVDSLQSSMNSVMTDIENLEEPEKQDFSVNGGVTVISKKTLLKFGLIGLVLGAFAMCGIYACAYLFAGVLATEDELKDIYGCFLLGAFAPIHKKQTAIDRLLYRMAGVEKRTDDVIAERIAQNISSLSKKGQTILLTGTVTDELLNKTLDTLKDKVQDVKLVASGCFVEDASAIGMIREADQMIVVEKRRCSKFEQVQKLLETASTMDKPVMGYIMY